MLKRSPKITIRARDHEGKTVLAGNFKSPKNSLRDAHLVLTWMYETLPPETMGTLLTLLISEFQPMSQMMQQPHPDFVEGGYED